MRLRRKTRIDHLQNEIRRRGNPWDRLIYFGLVALFLSWLFDQTLGDRVYLRANGLVLRDRVVLATQFTSQVTSLDVVEGSEVRHGQVVAQLRSQEVDQTLANISSQITSAIGKRTDLNVRLNVITTVRPAAEQAEHAAQNQRTASGPLISRGLISNKRVSELLDSQYKTTQALSEMNAEEAGIRQDLPQLDETIKSASGLMEQLKADYQGGRIDTPVDGIVGSLPVSAGSVVRAGDPLMEIFTGEPYVLAYVPEGALFTVGPGDYVNIHVGLRTYRGQITRMFAVTSQLPKEFNDTLRPPPRAQVIRIGFARDQQPPTLFAKPRITAAHWIPRWAETLFGHAKAFAQLVVGGTT